MYYLFIDSVKKEKESPSIYLTFHTHNNAATSLYKRYATSVSTEVTINLHLLQRHTNQKTTCIRAAFVTHTFRRGALYGYRITTSWPGATRTVCGATASPGSAMICCVQQITQKKRCCLVNIRRQL